MTALELHSLAHVWRAVAVFGSRSMNTVLALLLVLTALLAASVLNIVEETSVSLSQTGFSK